MNPNTRHPYAASIVYASALVQGLAVVSYPASASVLKQQLSDAQYGTLFLPQMIATVLGSALCARLGPRALQPRVLQLALLAAATAEALLLCAGAAKLGAGAAYAGTLALGFGFGLSAAPLNGLPARLFPGRAQTALVALHTLLAAGFALGPSALSAAQAQGQWWVVPALVCAGVLALALAAPFALASLADGSLPQPSAAAPQRGLTRDQAPRTGPAAAPQPVSLFAAAVMLYALCEGTFANWCVVYLREERGLSETAAAFALSMFWFALATGRLVVSGLLARVAAELIWRLLPLAMCAVFLLLPLIHGAPLAVLAFAAAGLACSAFFPLTVSLAAEGSPAGEAGAASVLTAALMVGVGIGSFVVGPLRSLVSLADLYRASATYPLLLTLLCGGLALQRRRARLRAPSAGSEGSERFLSGPA